MSRFILIPLLAVLSAILAGCATTPDDADFVRTVNFTPFDTFNYKRTLISGMKWRGSAELVLEERSEEVLTEELLARGFTEVEEGGDFFVVTKWRKAVSAYASPARSIDGISASINRDREGAHQFTSRVHLTVEIYEGSTGDLFWRADLPNIFDALQFTQERVDASLRRAIRNFPERVEKDPSLPNIE